MTLFLQQLLNGLVMGSVYALFALGFTLVFGVLHILNLAHGAVFMWGAFIGLYAMTLLHLPLLLAMLVAVLLAGVLSVAIDVVAFRPLRRRNAPEFSAIVSSIGAGLVLIALAQRASNTQVMRFPFGAFPVDLYEFAGLRVSLLQLTIVGTVAAAVTALIAFVFRTRFGRAIRAVAVAPRTASLLGVDPQVAYFLTFFISGALAGLAGVLIGLAYNSVHFLMGESLLLKAFVIIVLGGLGSVGGAVVGGLLLGMVHTMTVAFISSELADVVIFALLFALLLVRPQGLFGTTQREGRVVRH